MEQLDKRLQKLERQLEKVRAELDQSKQLNRKLRRDMRFFELMLLEEYQLLLQLLGKEKDRIRLHYY